MRRGTVVLILFILIAAAIVGISQFLRQQPAFEITVAVDPLAANWVRDAVEKFNATNPIVNATRRLKINLIQMDDTDVWQGTSGWTLEDHPAGWVAASSASIRYTPSNLPYTILQPSLARTPLLWGGFSSRVNLLTQDGAQPFDWDVVAQIAQTGSWEAAGGSSDWGFFKMAMNRPSSSMAGMAQMFSAVGHFGDTTTPTRDTLNTEFDSWFRPIFDGVPNFQTLGANPAQVMATRGTSTMDLALLLESQWLVAINDLAKLSEPISFSYPQYQFVLDFPLAVWNGAQITADERAAVELLGSWLLNEQSQQSAMSYGLRPAKSDPTAADVAFALAQPYGLLLQPDLGSSVQAPERNIVDRLLQEYD